MRRGHNIKVKRDGESSGCSRARMLNVRRLPGTAYGPRLLPGCTSTNERISPNAPEFVAMLTVSLPTFAKRGCTEASMDFPICDVSRVFFFFKSFYHSRELVPRLLLSSLPQYYLICGTCFSSSTVSF